MKQSCLFVIGIAVMLVVSLAVPSLAQIVQNGPVIAYVASYKVKGATVWDLRVMNADGTNQQSLWSQSMAVVGQIRFPSWSPNFAADPSKEYQGYVVFNTVKQTSGPSWALQTIQITINSAGKITSLGSPQPIPINPPVGSTIFGVFSAAWSPRGDWIALSGSGDMQHGIYLIPAPTPTQQGGGIPIKVVDVDVDAQLPSGPSWNSAGTWISYGWGGTSMGGEYVIKKQIIDVNGTPIPANSPDYPPIPLVNYQPDYWLYTPVPMQFSPAWSVSDKIAFQGQESSQSPEYIYFMDANPTNPPVNLADLTPLPYTPAAYPAWSPDGRYIIFSGINGIMRLDMTNFTVKTLANPKNTGLYQLDWRRE